MPSSASDFCNSGDGRFVNHFQAIFRTELRGEHTTGTSVTLKFQAGFLGDDLTLPSPHEVYNPTNPGAKHFNPKGDYVRFWIGGNDVTETAATYDPAADPETIKTKIAITGQRLRVNSMGVQTLELDVAIGAETPFGLADVDVKCGSVKAYSDSLSASFSSAQWSGAHRMKEALAVIAPRLIETRFATIDDDTSEPEASLQTQTRFHHLGPVTPLLIIDQDGTGLNGDSLTLSGRVISPARVLAQEEEGAPPTAGNNLVEVRIDDQTAQLDADGRFEATVDLIHPERRIGVTAYDAVGGFATHTILVEDDSWSVPTDPYKWNPTLQHLDFGSDTGVVKKWRTSGKMVTIDVRTLHGQTVDSTTLKLKLVDGKVLTERFIISPLGTDADESLAEDGNRVLVIPDLRHNLVVKVDSRDMTVIEMAGVQIDGIDGERFMVGDFPPVNPETSASSQAFETTRSSTLSARNIDGSVTVKVAGGFNGTARTPPRNKIIQLEDMEIGHGLQQADVPDLPLAMGSNHISLTANDRDQREVAQPHPDEVFVQHPGIPAHVNEDELSLDKQVLYIEVDGSHVDGSVPVGSNQTRMPLLNPLCRRLKLRVVGVEEYKQRGHHLVRVWLKHDGNRAQRDVLNELKTAGFIARNYRDDQNLVPALRDIPVTEQKLPWQTRTKPRSDWHIRVFNATQAMYDNQAATLNAMLQATPDRNVYVVDARSEPNFSAYGFTSSFAVRKPFLELETRAPAYAASDGAGPTYILKSFTITGADQARSESRSFPQAAGNGQPLRVNVANGPAVMSVAELIGPQTKGVIISIHGFNVDSSTQTGTKFMDGTLRNYWPMMQGMMRDPTLGNLPWNPQTKEGYLVLHVAWTGNYAPPVGFNRGLYFNWDMPLAHDAGNRVLWQMMRDINTRRDALNIPREDFPITILAESLGNRVALSLLNQFSGRLGDNGNEPSALTPLVRYTMAHPALRHVDLANQSPELKLPQSPIQTEIRALRANNQTALLFYSPFDKPGLIFNTAQNPPVGRELPEAFMLGRVGLQGTGYDYAGAPVNVRAFHANRGTVYEDVWHVTLFGWVLPGMQSVSRPTYEWNQTRNAVTQGLISLHESGGNIQITQPLHLTSIWRAMGRYAVTGVIPEGLDLEAPEVSTLLQGGTP